MASDDGTATPIAEPAVHLDSEVGQVDPSVYDDIIAVGKQISIAKQEGTDKEAYHRLGRVTASNHRQPWSMTWHNQNEQYCVPKGSRQELKENKHKCIPSRMRPDNHTALYDELRSFRRKGPKGSKAYTFEEGFRWPLDADFDPIVEQIHSTIYMDSADEQEGEETAEQRLGDDDFNAGGDGGVSEEDSPAESQKSANSANEFDEDEEGSDDIDDKVDYELSEGSEFSDDKPPRRATGTKRQHSPSPHITHKSMQKLDESDGEGRNNLKDLLEEAAEEIDMDEEAEVVEEAGEADDSDDDERPYPEGLYYLCNTEWQHIPHELLEKIEYGVPSNVMRYVVIQQANKVTGLQTISTLGPVFNEVDLTFNTPDPNEPDEKLKIKMRCGDTLKDDKHMKGLYPIVSTATDVDYRFGATSAVTPQKSQDIIVHSLDGSFSNRHKWSMKPASKKREAIGVARLSEYTHFRSTNIYLGPSVRLSLDKDLYAKMNAVLQTATCLTHYRNLFNIFLLDPVGEIQNFHINLKQEKRDEIAFQVAATDCTIQVTIHEAASLHVAKLMHAFACRLRMIMISMTRRQEVS